MSTDATPQDATPAPAPNTKIFVGNIPFKTTSEDLRAHFEKYGQVTDATVITRGSRSLGYGFVEMATEEAAAAAITGMNQAVIDERPINVELAKPLDPSARKRKSGGGSSSGGSGSTSGGAGARTRNRPRKEEKPRVPSETVLFVANLPFAADDAQLLAVFEGLNPVKAHIATKRTGRSKGFGFVEFANKADQEAALAARQDYELDGRQLNVRIAQDVDRSATEGGDGDGGAPSGAGSDAAAPDGDA